MNIVHAAPEDAHAVAVIHVQAWQAAYASLLPADYLATLSTPRRESLWRDCIASGTPHLLVAKENGVVRGWISVGPCRDERTPATEAELWALYVSPESWSTGTGRLLWQQARALMYEQGFTSCSLWVLAKNARAITFYQAAGFVSAPVPSKDVTLGGVQFQEVRYVCQFDS